VLKRVGLIASTLLLVLWVGSCWWPLSYKQIASGRQFTLSRGAFILYRQVPFSIDPALYGIPSKNPEWPLLVIHRWQFGWTTGLALPFWPLVLIFIVSTLNLYLRSRRPLKGLCHACGYDLTGNTSGTCPECGMKTSLG